MLGLTSAQHRRRWEDISGSLAFTTAQVSATLKAVRDAFTTIYIQRVVIWIKTDAAQSLSIEDNNATTVQVGNVPASPGAGTRWEFTYPDEGVPLTVGKDLKATFSAAGLAGTIEWEGYQRPTLTRPA